MPQTQSSDGNPAKDLIVHEDNVECPHCGFLDTLIEVDVSIRWNEASPVIEDGKLTFITWSLGDGNYDHERFMCSACEGEINLVTDVDQDWS